MPWRAAEAMHWQLGSDEIAQRAGVPKFVTAHVTSSAGASTPPVTSNNIPPSSEHLTDPPLYTDSPSRHVPPSAVGQPHIAITTSFLNTQPRPPSSVDHKHPRSQASYMYNRDPPEYLKHPTPLPPHRSPLFFQHAQPHRSQRSTSTVATLASHTSLLHTSPRRRSDSANRSDDMPPLLSRPLLPPIEGGQRLPPMKFLTEPDVMDYNASSVHYGRRLQPRDMEPGEYFRTDLGSTYAERYSPPVRPPDGGGSDDRGQQSGERGADGRGGGRG